MLSILSNSASIHANALTLTYNEKNKFLNMLKIMQGTSIF